MKLPEAPGDLNRALIRHLTWKDEDDNTVHGPGSNFFIEPDGTCVEAEFQAEKHAGYPWRQRVILNAKPGKAKKLGRKWKLTPEELKAWDSRKVDVMRELVLRKFTEHTELRQWLVDTGSKLIIEGNWWHDNFWGDCFCIECYKIGANNLGKILMDVRAVLK